MTIYIVCEDSGNNFVNRNTYFMGGSPGLVVNGDNLCSRGRGFDAQHQILDGHFSHFRVGSLIEWLWEEIDDEMVESLNPGTGY